MTEEQPSTSPAKDPNVISIKDVGEFLKSNGLASLLIIILIYGGREIIMWSAPRVDSMFKSTEALHKSLDDRQGTILRTQEQQTKNSEALLELHKTMQAAQTKDSRRIGDIHKAVVKKSSEPEDE